MAIVVTRTEAGLSATTSFQSMNNQFASSGLSLVVPSGVSQISSISMGVSGDANEADFCSGFKLTGTARIQINRYSTPGRRCNLYGSSDQYGSIQ